MLAYSHYDDLMRFSKDFSWGETLKPRMVKLTDGAVIIEPWDPEFLRERIDIDVKHLPDALLPAGEPFSRIWLSNGLWRPVRAA